LLLVVVAVAVERKLQVPAKVLMLAEAAGEAALSRLSNRPALVQRRQLLLVQQVQQVQQEIILAALAAHLHSALTVRQPEVRAALVVQRREEIHFRRPERAALAVVETQIFQAAMAAMDAALAEIDSHPGEAVPHTSRRSAQHQQEELVALEMQAIHMAAVEVERPGIQAWQLQPAELELRASSSSRSTADATHLQ
jgi:hypothetical protein